VTKEQIQTYLLFLLQERKLAPATVNLHMDAMRTFYKLMAPDSTIMADCCHVKTPKHIPVVLSREEVKKLIAAVVNIKHKAALMLLYSSGLRLQECLTLRPFHIESARMKVRVEQGKGKKDRYTVLSQRTLDTLREYCREYKPKKWLFEGWNGNHFCARSLGNIVRNATIKARLDKRVSPHTLRHSFATHLMESGVALPIIQQLLGHSNIKTTMIYLQVSEPMINRIKSPLDSAELQEVDNG
jgi:site-specific recombinase XerD